MIIQIKSDSAASWASKNPILLKGEPGFEEDTKKLKVGDGVTTWNDLPISWLYQVPGGVSSSETVAGVDPVSGDIPVASLVAALEAAGLSGTESVAGIAPVAGDVPVAALVDALQSHGISHKPIKVYDAQPQSRFYHQERTWILGGPKGMGPAAVTANNPCAGVRTVKTPDGTFTVNVNMPMVNTFGAAWSVFAIICGVQSGVPDPTKELWQQNNAQVMFAAPGVSKYQIKYFGTANMESITNISAPILMDGYAEEDVVTWQVVPFITGANMSMSSATDFAGATQPAVLAISPDDSTIWIPFESGVVIPVSTGGLPLWLFGLAAKDLNGNKRQWNSVAGTPIVIPGTSPLPYACYVSPDGTKVAVCNYGTNTVTFINTSTKAIIGTSTQVQASHHTWGGCWSADSTVFWCGQDNGKVYPITASTQVVGAAIAIGAATGAISMVLNAAGTAGFALDGTTGNLFPLSAVTDSSMTIGSPIALAGVSGANNIVTDPRDGSCWVSAPQHLYHCNAGGIIASNIATAFNNSAIAITADGLIIWATCGSSATNVVAFDTNTLQACLEFPKASGANLWGIALTSKGYAYYTDIGNHKLLGFPGAYVDIGLSGDIPFVGNTQIIMTGVE